MIRPFLLVFVGRSGSSALMHDLDTHSKMIVHMELFGEPLLPGGAQQTDDNRIALLHELWAGVHHPEWLAPEEVGCARGFKLQLKRAAPQFDDPPRLAAVLERYAPVVIALRRRDLLRQAISSLRAQALADIHRRERGFADYHITPDSGAEARAFAQRPIEVELGRLEQEVERFRLDRADLEALLQLCPPTVEVAYEDYLSDRLGVLNRVLEALELEPFSEAPPTTLAKVTDDDLSKAVTNFDELRAFAQARGLAL